MEYQGTHCKERIIELMDKAANYAAESGDDGLKVSLSLISILVRFPDGGEALRKELSKVESVIVRLGEKLEEDAKRDEQKQTELDYDIE